MTSVHDQMGDLITPAEAAEIMSNRAGYKITPDDLKQLRRHGKVKPAKQLARITLYNRAEIEHAPLLKKHNPQPVKELHRNPIPLGNS